MTSDDDAQLFINPTTIAWGNELSNVQCIYQIWVVDGLPPRQICLNQLNNAVSGFVVCIR